MGESLSHAIDRVVESGRYVFGPEVADFEEAIAGYASSAHAISCANGTDALALALMAWDLGAGDAVFCPSFTFCASAEVVAWVGAECVFVDIDERTFNMDPAHLEASIEATLADGRLRPKAIIAVDLFGLAADYPAIAAIARKHDLKLIADSAQGFGATLGGRHPVDFADVMTTSFYPAKPLGCYGDGGATLTNDEGLSELLKSLRNHGAPAPGDNPPAGVDADPRYLNMRIGLNSRLDTLQAAILLEKLKLFPQELDARDRAAARYADLLDGSGVSPPAMPPDGSRCVWAQYTIRIPRTLADRDETARRMREAGVPTAIYYPVPMHMNAPYRRYPVGPGGLPRTEAAAQEALSLPMHGYLDGQTQSRVVAALLAALDGAS